LAQIFDIKELSEIAKKFIGSAQYGESLKYINTEKLFLLQKLVTGDLFMQDGY
jgi:hypothetical protein